MEKPILQYTEITDKKVSNYFILNTILLFIFLPFTSLFLVGLAFSNSFSSGGGHYNIISSTPSPDGKNVVIVYAGWGGGAAGWTFLRVTVTPTSEQFDPKEHHDYIFDLNGGRDVETIWENSDNLLITYKYKPEKSNPYISVFRNIYSRNTGINIRYVERAE